MPTRTPLERSRIHRLKGFQASGSGFPPRAFAEISARALLGNYRAIAELAQGQAMIPMIKADAYGHGAEWAADLLVGMPGLYALGVATLEEGAAIRASLGPRGRRARIIVFSGASHWSEEKGAYCERHGLCPVIAGDEDWKAFARGGWPERLPYELKFNTGMNRLGMSLGFARHVVKSLRGLPASAQPQGVLTHLAMSEQALAPLTQLQVDRFRALKAELASAFPAAHFHLSNSGAIWNHKQLGLKDLTDVVRPGLALYGVPPWEGAPSRGIEPVLTFKASVIAVHQLRPGDAIGYGARFKVPSRSSEPVFAAILAAGYADGLQRVLSNQGFAWLNGKPTHFLGTVSMDLSAVAATAKTRLGDTAEILGHNVDPYAQAKQAGTIPYELLTSLSARVQRQYA